MYQFLHAHTQRQKRKKKSQLLSSLPSCPFHLHPKVFVYRNKVRPETQILRNQCLHHLSRQRNLSGLCAAVCRVVDENLINAKYSLMANSGVRISSEAYFITSIPTNILFLPLPPACSMVLNYTI